MKRVFFFFLLVLQGAVFAKESPKFAVSEIPADLMKDVNVVYREDQSIFTIQTRSKATHRVYTVVTILNPNGKSHASEDIGYDKLSKITTLRATVYDAMGFVVSRLKNSDIYDQSGYDGVTLFSDNRFKSIDLSQGTYPYTVEIEYEVEYKFLFFVPSFYVQGDEKVSVQHGLYTLNYAPGLAPRYKATNIAQPPHVEHRPDGSGSISFEFKNIKPLELEAYSKTQYQFQYVQAGPTDFEYDSYIGTMDSWDSFGKWINSLNKGRDVLSDETKRKIRSLAEKGKTDEEKIKILYEYLQGKTRYVSIQLGIGGFQPFEASVVDQTGYGDCKALSNYMVAMLKEVGIKANYVLIRAGKNEGEIDPLFPTSQFNHAIACVPMQRDTLWLECTSQTNPFGYQGRFTGDRKALMITDNGAKVVNTVHYPAEKNIQSRTGEVFLLPTGDATAKVKTTYSGLQYENDNLNFILDDQADDQKKWLQKTIDIPSFDVKSFSIKNHKDKIPSAVVSVDLDLKRFATVSGKRVFVTPNLMNRSTSIPEKVETRKTNVVLKMPFIDLDTIRYHLPEGIYPEFTPKPVTLKSRFGEYEASFTIEQNNVIYIRRLKMNKGVYPPESYAELIDFYKSLNRADATKIVFLSKT
ncbi:DUF3857 domain-containing protein [Chryseolinea lacunae]|uniref:DUF3857 domain-containing protein n=1 Tax=Chryseolinea lacunae TaxID=2801331 RepID=A0ABS1KR16_9BACT|nr:DUF3857 domain-containing protein [Chryseolinea lacunae]MBL0741814.1 DUF3857 domain-containing protein [Chryseolinea lacunae]